MRKAQKYKKNKHHKGFTLIELLVAVSLFSLIGGAAISLLISGISTQRDSLEKQQLFDQTSFLGEYMSRALRQAKKELGLGCLSPSRVNYQIILSGKGIRFIDKDAKCREFFLDDSGSYGILREDTDVFNAAASTLVDLTSADLDVEAFDLSLRGANQTDNLQPRVTFSLHAKARGATPEIFFQTTISQRRFDVQE